MLNIFVANLMTPCCVSYIIRIQHV